MTRHSFINKDVAAESVLQDRLSGEESSPSSYHIAAVAVMLNVGYDTLREHF